MKTEIETDHCADEARGGGDEGDGDLRLANMAQIARLYSLMAEQQDMMLDLLALTIKFDPKAAQGHGAMALLEKMARLCQSLHRDLQVLNDSLENPPRQRG